MSEMTDYLDSLAAQARPVAPTRSPTPTITRRPSGGGSSGGGGGGGGHVITRQDVIDMYGRYAGYPPTEDEIRRHVGQAVPDLDVAARSFFGIPSGGGGVGGGEFPFFEFPSFEPTEEERTLMRLQGEQLQEQIRLQKEENARVAARRTMLDKELKAKYGIGLEEFEGQEALRSANISRAQSERLQLALEGKLPVDPALERQITETEAEIRNRLEDQLGPGYETSTPGIESLATFRQRAEEMRTAARKGEIESGINPAAASAQFGLSLIGSERLPDTTNISQALQTATQSRAASIEAARTRAANLIALQDLALRSRTATGTLGLERERLRVLGQQGESSSGTGIGRLAGSILGTAAGAYFGSGGSLYQRPRGSADPLYT